MRLKIILAILALSFAKYAICQENIQSYHAPSVAKSLLLDIIHTDTKLIAVGERGHILLSSDGKQWSQASVPNLSTLTAIDFVGNNGWAVGHDATILKSHDGGENWEVQYFAPENERPFLDVLFFNESQGIAVGAYGVFYRTTNAGKTWLPEIHPEFLNPDDQEYLNEIKEEDEAFYLEEMASILPHLNRLSQKGERTYIAGEAGLLAFSDNYGVSWKKMNINYYGSFFDIVHTESDRIFAVGLRGSLFEYDAEEERWNSLKSGTTSSLNSIISIDSATTLVVGNNGAQVIIGPQQVSFIKNKNGKSIMNGISKDNVIITVTDIGIQQIQKDL
ncbi:MAG: photosystem II stability/assembly factor-like uncharacterized protein [Flavobacteriales bacterium]|jgi:photosystem II stability/assembly factor-like uncharacterized protein